MNDSASRPFSAASSAPLAAERRSSDLAMLGRIPGKVWLLIAAMVLAWSALIAWRVMSVAGVFNPPHQGDAEHVETYGFDLSTCLIPRDQIVATVVKDGIPALVDPDRMLGRDVETYNREHRGKFLVTSDRVIGVVINGEARAYPIRLLNWHEVANDTLGGVPIAVTYHPLCDSAVVFDRRLGVADEEGSVGASRVVTLAVSGLLYNSNHLLYDRADGEGGESESLWSQLLFKAVAGPAAEQGRTLRPLPMVVTTFARWLEQHPDTTVMRGLDDFKKRYARNPYGLYFAMRRVDYPVVPIATGDESDAATLEPFDRVMAIQLPMYGWLAVGPAEAIGDGDLSELAVSGQFMGRITPAALRDALGKSPQVAVSLGSGSDTPAAPTVHSLWFAWQAMHGGSALVVDEADDSGGAAR